VDERVGEAQSAELEVVWVTVCRVLKLSAAPSSASTLIHATRFTARSKSMVCGCSIEFIFSSTIPSIMLLGVLHGTDHSYNVAFLCSRSRTCVRTDTSSSEGWANSRSFTLKQAQYFCTLLPSNSVDSSSQPCLGGAYVSTNSPLCTFCRPHSFHSLSQASSRLPHVSPPTASSVRLTRSRKATSVLKESRRWCNSSCLAQE